MSEFKGTPGKFESEVIDMCNGELCVSVLDENSMVIAYCGEDETAISNAELFAAAPDLLKELQLLRNYVIETLDVDVDDCHPEHPLMSSQAAIAKALGEMK